MLSDARYWFRKSHPMAQWKTGPSTMAMLFSPMGALVLDDGSIIELDYTNPDDEKKIAHLRPEQVLGSGWRDRKTGDWRVEVKKGAEKGVGTGNTAAAATKLALNAYYMVQAAETALVADPAAYLARELARHDWWHMMSDSYGVTLAGECHMVEIRTVIPKVDPDTVRSLWAQHAPKEFACPV